MWCWHVRRDLTALTDGELSPRRLSAVRGHLERCPDCRAAWEDTERSVDLQRRLLASAFEVRDLAVDPMLREVKLRLDDDGSTSTRRWFWSPALITAAAVMGLVMVSVLGLFTPLLVAVGLEDPPEQVAQQPELFRDYPLFEHLETLENFDALQSGSGSATGVDAND